MNKNTSLAYYLLGGFLTLPSAIFASATMPVSFYSYSNPAMNNLLLNGKNKSDTTSVEVGGSYSFFNGDASGDILSTTPTSFDIGGHSTMPGVNLLQRINDKVVLGVQAGTVENTFYEYDPQPSSFVPYSAESTANRVATNLSYQLNSQVSLGAGIEALQYSVDENGVSKTGNWGYGGNLGLVYSPRKGSYLSGFYDLPMDIKDIPGLINRFPGTLRLSIMQFFNEKFALSGDVTDTMWSRMNTLYIGDRGVFSTSGKDVWAFTVAAQYQYTPKWLLKAGMNYDGSIWNTNDQEFLFVSSPDNYTPFIKADYAINQHWVASMGFTHTFSSTYYATFSSINTNLKVEPNTNTLLCSVKYTG